MLDCIIVGNAVLTTGGGGAVAVYSGKCMCVQCVCVCVYQFVLVCQSDDSGSRPTDCLSVFALSQPGRASD